MKLVLLDRPEVHAEAPCTSAVVESGKWYGMLGKFYLLENEIFSLDNEEKEEEEVEEGFG